MDNMYKLTIENGSKKISLESTDPDWIEKKQLELVALIKLEKHGNISNSKSDSGLSNEESISENIDIPKKITIQEFYKNYCSHVKVNTDISVFVIYYLSTIQNVKDITTGDIKKAFVDIGIPKANIQNYADMLGRAKKRALLNYINNKWSLTITGEDFVLNKLQSKKSK